ncbi:MAG: Multidrug transporter permease [Rhodoglobus sp.]|nr:Multidrug transporter permease [Rhodoglobus sp.]
MTPAVLALIAVGAVTHASWNLWIKHTGAGGPTFVWLQAVVGSLFVLPFAIALHDQVRWNDVLLAASVSAVLHIAYFLLLQRGYRAGDVSVVYPLARGSGPLITVVVAILFLGERPGLHAVVGAAVVIAGVMVIGFAGGLHGMRAAGPGVFYGLLTGCMIAAYTLWDAHAVTTLAVAPVVLSLGSTVGQAVLLAPIALGRPVRLKEVVVKHWRDALVVGVLSPVSYIAILFAMQLAPVSIVAPGREVSVVLVGLAGWLLFREPHPVQRLVGAGVVLAGVALLAL